MKIIFSPHPDDAFISLGGAILNWAKAGEKIKVVDFFTVSNYTNRGLQDPHFVTSIRKGEEITAAASCNAEVEFIDLKDSFLRGYSQRPYPTEINWGIDNENFEKIKHEILERAENNECYFPLGIGHHVDHILVREAAAELIKEGKVKKYFFYEDQYYAAKCHFVTGFAKSIHIVPRLVKIDFDEKQKLMDIYQSQVEQSWSLVRNYARSITSSGFHERIWG
jgi:LmbE family N-acetylglucosaminyl deacetylase